MSTPVLPLRLPPGVDLRRALEDALRERGVHSAFVLSGIGSLSGAVLRLAAAEALTRRDGPFEILSLQGSVSADGAHLHIAVANARGEVLGGHLPYGNVVRTTAEILVAPTPGWVLSREPDAATGHAELVVRASDPGLHPQGE